MITNSTLNVHSFVYHPTISEVTTLQYSNRGIFPSSLYNLVESEEYLEGGCQVSDQPIIFRISGEHLVKEIYVTAHEFSAMDGLMYISSNLMNDSFIENGTKVNVNIVTLPKVTRIILQPRCSNFARNIEDPKGALELAIVERYQVLSIGDTVKVGDFILEVTQLEPANSVITNTADPEVEFIPCWEDIEREKQEQIKKKKLEEEKLEKERAKERANQEAYKAKMIEENYQKTGHMCIPFGGVGRRLDNSSQTATNVTNNQSNPSNPSNPKTSTDAKNLRNYKIFSGEGRRLGD